MTKADLIDLIAERTKLPHGRAELLICQMFDSMVDALCRGEGIELMDTPAGTTWRVV